ncbi:hypothetical protein KP509_09G027800 [Ceratopteris richardii]|nr:hypothetical protein KP509_09G027800 [Ceratopteris richardii]
MRTECKHFASAYASAKPLLTGSNSDQSNWLYANGASNELPTLGLDVAYLEYSQVKPADLWHSQEAPIVSELDNNAEFLCNDLGYSNDLFFVEEPTSSDEADVEDTGYIYDGHNVSSEELFHDNYSMGFGSTPKESSSFTESQRSINLNAVCTSNPQLSSDIHEDLSCICAQSTHIAETPSRMPCCSTQSIMSFDSSTNKGAYPTDLVVEVSQTAIVPIPEAAQIPAPKLKSIGRLRTIHYVYELPDDHELLKMLQADARQKDDPCCYLLAIWSPGETPESQQEIDELCRDDFSAFTVGRADENVSGTLLIPCRTAMRGSFPLNGTYFQVNEVFADHSSSLCPVQVPRSLIWSLRRRFVYFGTSIPNIFKGLSREEIKDCFWRGHVCVRGFDRKTRAPKPLVCRLHFPISKQLQGTRKAQGRKKEEAAGLSLESSRKQCSTKQVDFLEFERANTTL